MLEIKMHRWSLGTLDCFARPTHHLDVMIRFIATVNEKHPSSLVTPKVLDNSFLDVALSSCHVAKETFRFGHLLACALHFVAAFRV